MGHRRSATYWFNLFGAVGLVLAALVGCSGDDGAAGTPGTNAVATVPASSSSITALTIKITGVTVASPPVVRFSVADQYGSPVSGLQPDNLRFDIAKLIPGSAANGNLDSWQNYVVRRSGGRIQGNRETPTAANLTDNGDGTYSYTFQTDITNASCPPPATDPCNDAYGNPIDLSYNASLTHRVGMQIRRGSTTLPLANQTYTFRPSDGATTGITLRDIVKTAKCNQCHATLQAHDQRIETKYCVTCHNPGTTANGQVGTVQGNIPVDFKVMIHKIHSGEELPSSIGPDGYAYTADDYDSVNNKNSSDYGVIGYSGNLTSFKEVAFPQNIRNCTKCHDGSDPDTPQGDNWKNRPSIQACGSCHDNVYFGATATQPYQTKQHSGGVQPLDNTTCASCHSNPTTFPEFYVPTVHVPVEMTNTTPGAEAGRTGFQDNLPAGASKITYEIKSNGVTVSGTPQRATVVFRILRDGTPVTFNASAPMLANFTGGPSFYVAYAVPQDGITTPADYNVNASAPNVSLANLWDGTRGTLSAPDGSGYYTAVLGGGSTNYTSVDIPTGATRVTVGMLNSFVQTNVTGFPGGLTLTIPAQMQTAAGYTARRTIASRDKCNACHATLGTAPTFHGGNRNDPSLCAFCHNSQGPSSTRSWPARSTFFVHAIHGAGKREVKFNWHASPAGTFADAPTNTIPYLIDTGFWQVAFPGILNNCEACHLSGTYDFSASAYTPTLIDNMLYTYAATCAPGTTTTCPRSPDVETSPWALAVDPTLDFGLRFNSSTGAQAAANTLVISPIATVCFACHDTSSTKAHMEANGALIYAARGSAASLPKTEQCLVCHGPGKVAAIAEMHAK